MALLGWPKTIKWSHFGSPRGAVPSSYGGSHADCHIAINIATRGRGRSASRWAATTGCAT